MVTHSLIYWSFRSTLDVIDEGEGNMSFVKKLAVGFGDYLRIRSVVVCLREEKEYVEDENDILFNGEFKRGAGLTYHELRLATLLNCGA